MNAIETEGLARRFGARWAVQDLDLEVPKGAVYGFLGRNGAGKTTTIRMLLGLCRPTAGQLRVAGADVRTDRLAAARRTGALLEHHGLYGNLTGRQNLDLTRRLLGLPPSEIDRVLEAVDLKARGGDRVAGYSQGMRQRLGLARALMGRPEILILDEPTNGLDPEGIAEMRAFLRDLPARSGATVLLSSHLLGEIEQTASHVGILVAGRLKVQGALAELRDRTPPELEVDCDDAGKARALLQSAGLQLLDGDAGVTVRLASRDGPWVAQAAALNRRLVEAGLAVSRLAPRQRSLERLYAEAAASPETAR
ncbi:MAG TPA: ABC transporter ATP-binding protein [Brevundimonas sp.]|jgi:ABC-2 type transport system ATP-binding protein|uniref:ABC transporter ATP-binding protein n=1 Tax=Brevundimonas sp. TaxID=1871086 RepID=UPI002E10A12A|nr:ABC transporter ATP-binding protein [Brevundimonas sp.]